IDLFPRLRTSQIFEYQVSYHSEREIKTETPAFAPTPTNTGKINITGLIHLEILSVQARGARSVVRARTDFRILDTHVSQRAPTFERPSNQLQKEESGKNFIAFTFLPNGRLEQIAGLDQLPPEQQEVWQEWLSRFLLAATLPSG